MKFTVSVSRKRTTLIEFIQQIYSQAVYGKHQKDENATKLANLQQEYLSNERLWIRVGAVFNVYMRPIFSGRVMVLSQYSYTDTGLMGVHNYSALRHNMLVIYNQKNRCIQRDGQDFDFKEVRIAATKNEIQLMAPNTKKLILNVDNIIANKKIHYLKSSFYEKYLVQTVGFDCGEEAKTWISEYLDHPDLSLAYITPQKHSPHTFWHNIGGIHSVIPSPRDVAVPVNVIPQFKLISYPTFLEVNKLLSCPRLIESYNADICIVPKDTKPFEELEWEWIQIGEIVLRNINPLKRHKVKFDPKDMPVEMKMKLIVLHCELYNSGTMQIGDEVFVRQQSSALIKEAQYHDIDD